MIPEEKSELKILISESEQRIHQHIGDVQKRMTSGLIFLFLSVLFPGFAVLFVVVGLLLLLFYPLFKLVALPFQEWRTNSILNKIKKENQEFNNTTEQE